MNEFDRDEVDGGMDAIIREEYQREREARERHAARERARQRDWEKKKPMVILVAIIIGLCLWGAIESRDQGYYQGEEAGFGWSNGQGPEE